MKAEAWLKNEDDVCRQDRIKRLEWMERKMPNLEWMAYGSGLISKHLFEEAKYCYAYGQFLASIVLGLSFIEVSLGGAFYGIGRNDLTKAGLAELSKEALGIGWLSKKDYDHLEKARKYRNPVVHFRTPGHEERIEARAAMSLVHSYEIIEKDARFVMVSVFRLLPEITPWRSSVPDPRPPDCDDG